MVRRVIIKTSIICIITIFAAVFLSVCENSLDAYIENDELQAQEADILAAPSKNIPGNVITGHEEIILTFDETIDKTTLSLGGTLGNSNPETNWGQEAYADDTVYINTTNLLIWPEGNGKTLTVSCTAASGKVLTGYSFTLDVFYGTCVYVDSTATPFDGSVMRPYNTIQAGIDQADSKYVTAEVRVASGTYGIDGRTVTGAPLEMEPGISVYGGYSTVDWTTRDTTGQPSIIEDTSTVPGTEFLQNIIVSFSEKSPRIGNSTIFNGFTLKPATNTGSDYDKITAITCDNADPTLQDITIEGIVTNTNVLLYGLYITSGDDSSPIIDDCTVFETWTGSACDYSYALYNYGSGEMTVQNSTLCGGRAATRTWCIVSLSSSTVTGCTIESGRAGTDSIGIFAYGGSADISGCDIYIGDDSDSFTMTVAYGIWVGDGGSTPSINNNTFYWNAGSVTTECYAIYEAGPGDDPTSVSTNSFDDDFISNSTYGYYWDNNDTRIPDMITSLTGPDGTLGSFGNTTFID